MKILLTVTSLEAAHGGQARSVSRLATALTDAGLDVAVWAADQSAPRTPFLKGAPVSRLAGPPRVALDRLGRPDVIHDNGIWFPHHHHLATAAARRRIPRVVSTRGMLQPWAFRHKAAKKRLAWWLYQRRDLIRADCHHAATDVEAAHLEALRLGVPVRVVPNGVDIPQALRREPPSGARTALFLGRIYPIKGLPMLIDAWARVRPDGWRLQIAGPDQAGHRASVEALVANARLHDVVTFSGDLDDEAKRAAFARADLFVLPSHSESFGMVIAEALAHGLPVLTTTGAPWPMLAARGCGWQVHASADALEHGLRAATSLPVDDLRRRGADGRDFVGQEFDWPRIARRFIRVYEELVAG